RKGRFSQFVLTAIGKRATKRCEVISERRMASLPAHERGFGPREIHRLAKLAVRCLDCAQAFEPDCNVQMEQWRFRILDSQRLQRRDRLGELACVELGDGVLELCPSLNRNPSSDPTPNGLSRDSHNDNAGGKGNPVSPSPVRGKLREWRIER